MYIEFRYNLSEHLYNTLKSAVDLIGISKTINGWMNVADATKLRHCQLFLVCKENLDTEVAYEPLAIVASREPMAIAIYCAVTGAENATVYGSLEFDCSKIKVQPTNNIIE